ncbi:hypothetical protein, partial [Limosilactobacillus reuteri]|uniref:hypothetical protein n=1 Tax=Limosilactobacillus reuteri TaxID=1598 RepID=UPI00207D0219
DKWAEIGPAFTEGGKVAIKVLADITVGIISGIGWLTSSGAAADKWATAFEGAMDRLWKLFGGENDPVAEWIFWISDSLE